MLTICPSADNTECCRNINSLQSVGIWNLNAFYIFDNISAAAKFNLLRHLSEYLVCFRSRIGNRNRFGTSEGRNKFVL